MESPVEGTTPITDQIDFKAAILDPASAFASPEDILEIDSLTQDQKIEILRRWEYDAGQLSVAEEEGMMSDEPSLIQRVVLTLNTLVGNIDMEDTPPTKAGGIPRNSIKTDPAKTS